MSACSNGQSNEAVLSQSASQWKNDLNYLAEQLPNLHKNSFHSISKEAFKEQVNILSNKIDKFNDDQIVAEMMRLVALTGDGHTHLSLPPTLNRYPLEFAQFDKERKKQK